MTEHAPARRTVLRAASAAAAGTALAAAAAPAASAAPRPHLVDRATPRSARPLGPHLGPHAPQLVFSDEFTGSTLDTAKWTAADQHRGSGNSGVDYWYKPENVSVADGRLALAISKLGTDSYGGSRIDSQGKFDFAFGTVEYRMLIPPTIGHLAAAWLQASNGLTPGGAVDGTARDGAEVDIVESFSTGDEYGVTLHWDGYGADHQSSNTVAAAPGLHDAGSFHTIGVAWTPTQMQFTYDGAVVRTVTDPELITQVREFPIASNEIIGYAQGDVRDAPLGAASTMYVDWIRVWQ